MQRPFHCPHSMLPELLASSFCGLVFLVCQWENKLLSCFVCRVMWRAWAGHFASGLKRNNSGRAAEIAKAVCDENPNAVRFISMLLLIFRGGQTACPGTPGQADSESGLVIFYSLLPAGQGQFTYICNTDTGQLRLGSSQAKWSIHLPIGQAKNTRICPPLCFCSPCHF